MNTKPTYLRALNKLTARNVITAKEIADLIDRNIRSVYHCLSGKEGYDFRAHEIETISKYLANHENYDLALAFLPPGFRVSQPTQASSNGDIADELMNMTEIKGRMISAWKSNDFESFVLEMELLRHQFDNLEAEGRLLK